MRDFSFVGVSRLKGAKNILPTAIDNWMRQWCFDAGLYPLSVDIEDASNVSVNQQGVSRCWLQLAGETGSIWLGYDELSARKIIFSDYSTQLPSDDTARALLRLALQALLEYIMAALGHPTIGDFQECQPENPYRFGSALVMVNIEIQGLELHILIDAKLLNKYLPTHNPMLTRALVKRQEAITQAKVTLSISLPLAKLQIDELSQLRTGDIIRGQVLLTQPFQVAIEHGRTIANASLGRTGKKIAIQLTDTAKKLPLERFK